ncbi:Polyphenol oxidase [Burkholderiales bacterium 8X]|nr:Polyphenol oxidase [Burkholderiales bacterium 8X]
MEAPAGAAQDAGLDWLRLEWPAPANVHAACTTRQGGFSRPPYGSLNLGAGVGDEAADVEANRRLLGEAIGAKPVFMKQVHGTRCLQLDADSVDRQSTEEADAAWTLAPRIACTVMVADCLPVLFCSEDGSRVAAAHAGWRGLAAGVLEQTVAQLLAESGQAPSSLMAWLGPCIGPDAFEVGPEVKAAFEAQHAESASCFAEGSAGKWMADLQGLARQRLTAMGLTRLYGNDGGKTWCTVNNPLLFFSHRRDRVSGRFGACIWRD